MKRPAPRHLLLALVLLAGLLLRVWNNDYGLPFIWSIDEGSHFTNRAVEMFREGLDPGYYQNPAAYTYLVYALLRLMYGPLGFLFDLPFGNVTDQFNQDPSEIWIAARTLAAVLCMAGVAATYGAARRLWGPREGIVAAAVLSFAFLPVAYSRVAVTDVGALIGVALCVYWSVCAAETRWGRDFVLAGAAAGLAAGFKYTAGLVLLPMAIAALSRVRRHGWRPLAWAALGGLAALGVFVALNPYFLLEFDSYWSDLRGQASVAANEPKPGQEQSGLLYYLDSLTWGLGWLGALAALAGAVVLLRRDLVRGLILISFPLALFLYLSAQSRYFGRWLLPAYPVLALLCAYAVGRAAELAPDRRMLRLGLAAVLALLVVAQPLAADVRTGQVLGRDDTREQARDFLVKSFPPELRVSIEPAVPGRYYRSTPAGVDPPWLRRCARRPVWEEPGFAYRGPGGEEVCVRRKPGQFSRPDGGVRASAFHLALEPEVIDQYRFYGYCLVMTFGTVRDRALGTGQRDVKAYYDRLDREADVLREFSPYDEGAEPEEFSFDLSFNYYAPAYHRPGPSARIHRLRDCREAYGAPIIPIPQARELPPLQPRDESRPADQL